MVELSDLRPIIGTDSTLLYVCDDQDMIWDIICAYHWDYDKVWESEEEIEDSFWRI